MKKILLTVVFGFASSVAIAADERPCTITLSPGVVAQVEVEQFFVADICLAGGEAIGKYRPGNTRAWEWASDVDSNRRLLVRVPAAGERTNVLLYGEGERPARYEIVLVAAKPAAHRP